MIEKTDKYWVYITAELLECILLPLRVLGLFSLLHLNDATLYNDAAA